MTSAVDGGNDVDAARAALNTQDWPAAYEHAKAGATAAVAQGGATADPIAEGDRLDLLADAAWWVGRLDECIIAREQAYACYDAAGAHRKAGQCAIWLYLHHGFKARSAIATGWLRRARRALDGDTECMEYGHLLLYEAEVAHGSGDLARSAELAATVLDLGRRLRAPDLEAQALQATGWVLIADGKTAEGLAHLDEAMLFAIEGRLTPFVTGKVYCSLVSACHQLGDIRRATEWTQAVGSWADAHPQAVFPGLCRLHRAELLQLRGEWEVAEAEAQLAGRELEDMFIPNAAAAFAEVGEVRRRRGDLAGAEEAFARADAMGMTPARGLALLRLAQRRTDAASSIISAALEGATWNRLERAWLLSVEVQVAIACDDVERAKAAATELEETASRYESPLLLAEAATAAGRVELAMGSASACGLLHKAVRLWQELDVPYETGVARALHAQACREGGDDDGWRASAEVARGIFDRLGARLDAEALAATGEARTLPGGLSERELEVLRLVAAGHTNKQIAKELTLSDKTVARHLSNIFAKIEVSSRVAATVFAYEHDLVAR